MTGCILEIDELGKSFGGQRAADGLSLRLDRGEIRCLIGPNGAGKSTALQLIAGLQQPDAGRIVFAGEDITRAPVHERAQRGIGIKFQVPSIFSALSVRQNLRIAVQANDAAGEPVAARVDDLLHLLGLDGRVREAAGSLSHGQKQWLEIGMAVGRGPDLLLLDEPTAGMSPQETERTGELIAALNRAGLTVLAVEHDMRFVRQIASRVTVMQAGRVFFEGTPDEVMAHDGVGAIYLGAAA